MLSQFGVASERLLFTVEEAAQVLNLGRTYTYRLVMCKRIGSIKVGRKRLIPASALHDFVTRQFTIAQKGEH
jgi:excisionase family DNA binding protein